MTQPTEGAGGATAPLSGTGTGGSDGTTGTGTATPPEGGAVTPPASAQGGVTQEEYDQLKARMQAADRAKSTAEQALAQLRDKDLPEADKLRKDNETLSATVAALKETNRKLAIGNAFSLDNSFEWHDPRAAMTMVDQSRLTVNEDGTVEGMKVALKALADANPWMIKPKEAAGAAAPPAVGVPPVNGGRPSNDGKATPDALKSRFPAMRSRLG